MESNNRKQHQKKSSGRDYDREIRVVLDEALQELDPELMKTIELVSRMNESKSENIRIITSSTGTS